MTINYNLLLYIAAGITLITMLDTIGAIASRKLNFNYGMLALVSSVIYTNTGYLISKEYSLGITLLCNTLIGIYDATAGWYFSVKLKANTDFTEDELKQLTVQVRILITVIFAIIFGYIGYR